MPSLLDSPQQQLPTAGAWSSLYDAQEPVKPPRHVLAVPVAAAKKPPYGGRKKSLEMCTEALGCETGGVDAAAADDAEDGAERKRRTREEEEEAAEAEADSEATEGRVRRCGVLPPPLTTLARGASRVRMVHERRDGRLAVYAVRTPGMEAERSGGRLRLRLLPCGGGGGNAAESNHQESNEAEEEEAVDQEGDEYGVAKYVRGGRCMEAEGGATAARRGKKKWEPEPAAAFWVATT